MKQFTKLEKLKKGDQVGIISPSAGLPGLFPWVQDLGLQRLTEQFGLTFKEYPTTRQMNSSLEDRARDIMAAFADTNNKAVIASIGGFDQVKLIKLLDKQVFLRNPKPFFGYSDNTHLHNFLWDLGIPSYYGGGIMNQFAMNAAMDELTVKYLKHALFDQGEFELEASRSFNDVGLDWADKDTLNKKREQEPNEGLIWDTVVGSKETEGVLWGGCVDSFIVQSSAGIYLPKDDDLEGAVLYLETSEDIPDHWIIEYLLVGFGERGWFDKFKGVLIGRPKAWEFAAPNDQQWKQEYRKQQRETVVRVAREYNKSIPIIQNLDFGHTDPQVAMPNGGKVRIDSKNQKIYLTY